MSPGIGRREAVAADRLEVCDARILPRQRKLATPSTLMNGDDERYFRVTSGSNGTRKLCSRGSSIPIVVDLSVICFGSLKLGLEVRAEDCGLGL